MGKTATISKRKQPGKRKPDDDDGNDRPAKVGKIPPPDSEMEVEEPADGKERGKKRKIENREPDYVVGENVYKPKKPKKEPKPKEAKPKKPENTPAQSPFGVSVALDEADKVAWVSCVGRTESPFGYKTMGDHTVAWQAVIDALQADLHDLSVAEAITTLRRRHEKATARTLDDAAFSMIDDGQERRDWLADVDEEFTELLDRADAALTPGPDGTAPRGPRDAAALLQGAIRSHLTLLNLLPFATVRPKGPRGATGNGEGSHRKRAIVAEKARTDDDLARIDKAKLHTALSGMFSYSAAIRETWTMLAVDTTLTSAATKDFEKLTAAVTAIRTQMKDWKKPGTDASGSTDGTLGDDVTTPKPWKTRTLDRAAIRQIVLAAGKLSASGKRLNEFDTAFTMLEVLEKQVTKYPAEPLTDLAKGIETALTNLEKSFQVAQDIYDQRLSPSAIENAALVMASLLHEHHQTVATAYPQSVRLTEFLGPPPAQPGTPAPAIPPRDAADVAADQFAAALTAELVRANKAGEWTGATFDTSDPNGNAAQFLKKIKDRYRELGLPVVAPGPASWVANPQSAKFLVTYQPGAGPTEPPILEVFGRPDPPPGVAGMGSHTTAWVLERTAVAALVVGPPPPPAHDPLAALHGALVADLTSKVIALDALLPAAQLEGGQLIKLFGAAHRVTEKLAAKDVQGAATAYLEMRNLLPFATVDAGDRGGHAEHVDAPEDVLFDDDSLEKELDVLEDEFWENDGPRPDDDEKLRQTRVTELKSARVEQARWRAEAAAELNAAITAAGWGDPVAAAAGESVRRLSDLGPTWETDRIGVKNRVMQTRLTEHQELYQRRHTPPNPAGTGWNDLIPRTDCGKSTSPRLVSA